MNEQIRPPAPRIGDPIVLEQIIERGTARYFDERRARLPAFLEANFSMRGAAGLNAHAFGHDLWRAPANIAMAGPALALKGAAKAVRAAGARQLADRMERADPHIRTDVDLELEWRIYRDLLELPLEQPERDRVLTRDALAEKIFSDPKLDEIWHPVLSHPARRAADPSLRLALERALTTYHSTRMSAGELTNLGLSLAAGAAIVHQTTPGLVSLAPSVAQAAAEKLAIAHFPLGPGIAKVWYSAAPFPPSMLAGATASAGVLAGIAALSALSGFVLDPVQYRLGLHERRLTRLLDALEQSFLGNTASRYVVRDHYLARLLDAVDLVSAVWVHIR